jgi:DNA-directed RNA polymerase specialized sigma24 family protein
VTRLSSRPSTEQINAIYRRLLTGEPDASNDFIELLLDPLVEVLCARFPNLPHPDLIMDVVIDALFRFVQSPEKYRPERGELWNYLYMDVQGDLRNALAKEQRRRKKEVPFDPVAHDRADGNTDVEEEIVRQLDLSSVQQGRDAQAVLSQLRLKIPDPRDWQVVLLMFNGERHTSAFAAVLGIEHLPITKQREQVKKTKDRLRLRLKRYGVKIHEQ